MPTGAPARTVCALAAALLLVACAGAPPRVADEQAAATRVPGVGERIAASALAQVGQPYRYGGNGPDEFDCSGLVRFVHAAQGIDVPRTTAAQFASAALVARHALAAGDLLFFRFDGPDVSHVGIYVGNGRFVHAPKSGREVEQRRLDDPWYQRQLVSAGRLF
jgi:cell wall-associated NlpC family hydrolase